MLQLADPKLKLKCLVILHKIPESPPFTPRLERTVPPLLKESDAQKIFLWKVRLCHVTSSPNLTLSSHSSNQKIENKYLAISNHPIVPECGLSTNWSSK